MTVHHSLPRKRTGRTAVRPYRDGTCTVHRYRLCFSQSGLTQHPSKWSFTNPIACINA